MYQNSIPDLPRLRSENYESIFNVHTEEDGRYYYNLLQAIVIPDNLPAGFFNTYNVTYGDTWPFISYKSYNTPNLWWIILSVNNIINPTENPKPGSVIKILKMDVVKSILSEITTQNN
jgi:nucleoid-associated protein YgaU